LDTPRGFSCSRCGVTERLFLLLVLNDQETFLALGFGQTERLFLLSVLSDRETFPALGVE